MARELASLSGFELTGQRRRILRGVGPVTPSLLRRATSAGRCSVSGEPLPDTTHRATSRTDA